jgi:ribonuclease-3
MASQLNENNRLITIDVIEQMFNKINITDVQIKDLSNYQLAFVHRSYVRKVSLPPEDPAIVPFQTLSNEVLEFEGDSILGSYVARYLHDRYPKENEGFLTTLKSRLVKTESLSKFANYLGFNDYLIISKYVEEQNGRSNPKLLENTFEAFIGAIYQDQGGFDMDPYSLWLPHSFIKNVIERTINFADLNTTDDNYKDQLMRVFHQHFKGRHAVYRLLETKGVSNNCTFTCGVVHPLYPEVIVAKGSGRKKPLAEQNAAREALKRLDEIVKYQPSDRKSPKSLESDADTESIGD